MMGVLADAVLKHGGKATGIIPRAMVQRELAHPGLTALQVVDSMHQRKARMAELSDGFIALPGGIGTLDELFETFCWAQLDLHRKPFGLLNTLGYYDTLIEFLDHAAGEGFLHATHRDLLLAASDPGDLLDRFAGFVSPERGFRSRSDRKGKGS